MRVKASYPDANVFRNLFEVLGKMIDEVKISFSGEGLRIRAMDPANVALIDVRFPREAFTEFEVEDPGEAGINLSLALKLLKRAKRGDKLDLHVDDENVRMVITGVVKREFVLRNIEVISPEIPEATLSLETKIVLLVDPLRQALKDLELVGETATFLYDGEEKLVITARSQTTYKMELTKESGAVIDIESGGRSEASYSVDYLLNVLSLVKVADTVRLEFSTQMPMRMEFTLPGGGTVEYLLAPSAT